MREIKFRAWDTRNKRMVVTGFHILGEVKLFGQIEQYCYETRGEFDTLERLGDIEITQFTGLRDKGGKEIYESDIVRMDGKYTYEVRFEDGKFVAYHLNTHAVKGTKWGDLHRFFDPDFAEYYVEVIGSLYETPELLKP